MYMIEYVDKIKKMQETIPFLVGEKFVPATSGTHHKVFISQKFVIRFRTDNPELLAREAKLLKLLKNDLIPRVEWIQDEYTSQIMIENRLSGKTVDTVWVSLNETEKNILIHDVVAFLRYLRNQTFDSVYSVNSGKTYSDFMEFLTDQSDKKIARISSYAVATTIAKEITSIIEHANIENVFTSVSKYTLVHGDLIIHNLLTEKGALTGVLDWELALYGDPEYDICRLFYYQECAQAYREQGVDNSYEADYMDRLVVAIEQSDLIQNKTIFNAKYTTIRAVFYLNALFWAAHSTDPEHNLLEIIAQWDKKKRATR